MSITLPPELDRLAKTAARLSSPFEAERATAGRKLSDMMERQGLTWHGVFGAVATGRPAWAWDGSLNAEVAAMCLECWPYELTADETTFLRTLARGGLPGPEKRRALKPICERLDRLAHGDRSPRL